MLCLGFGFVMLAVMHTSAKAQYYFYNNNYFDNPLIFEFGGSVGAMNCLTDLGGKKGIGKKFIKDLNLGNTNVCGSIFFSAQYKYALTVTLQATFGKVSAHDSVLKPVAPTTFGRYERNLSFRSSITEVSLMAELHPLYAFINWAAKETDPPRLSPYVTAGIGFFSFNPQANLNGSWIDLQPLSTEGQGFKELPDRKKYNLSQISFPLGAGVRYELSPMFNLRAEFVYRVLNTDYLDDVSTTYIDPTLYANYLSGNNLTNALLLNDRQHELKPNDGPHTGSQRGNSKNNDCYFSFNLKAGLILGRSKRR